MALFAPIDGLPLETYETQDISVARDSSTVLNVTSILEDFRNLYWNENHLYMCVFVCLQYLCYN